MTMFEETAMRVMLEQVREQMMSGGPIAIEELEVMASGAVTIAQVLCDALKKDREDGRVCLPNTMGGEVDPR